MMLIYILYGVVALVGVYHTVCYVLAGLRKLHPATSIAYSYIVELFQIESRFCEEGEPSLHIPERDADLFSDPAQRDIRNVRSQRRIPYAARVAQVAKSHVGLLSHNKANYLVYQRLCRDEMVRHNVRPSHIAHTLPIAVAACFVPLDSDWLGASMLKCDEHKSRLRQIGEVGNIK